MEVECLVHTRVMEGVGVLCTEAVPLKYVKLWKIWSPEEEEMGRLS